MDKSAAKRSVVIVGAQWGDEGKGKIADLLALKADYVVRYQGGSNAGHTIWVAEKKMVLHLIPSGIAHDHTVSVIAHGVVFDPLSFVEELKSLESLNIFPKPKNLKVSLNAPVVTSYHKILDRLRETHLDSNKIGTTGKGIGPCYEDKVARRSLLIRDLFSLDTIKRKLEEILKEKEVLFESLYNIGEIGIKVPSLDEESLNLFELGKRVLPYSADTFDLLFRAQLENKKILYEGAQGVLLDIDYGTYPFVTSSSTSVGGIFTGSGFALNWPDEVLGITKAYVTRVGSGPFPTELSDSIGKYIQKTGQEVGATTGRERRCGWQDLPLLKYSVLCSKLTSIALTKLDVLCGMDELKVCYAYEYEGKTYDVAFSGMDLAKVKPLYKSLKPFSDKFDGGPFSKELNDYIECIESHIKIPIGITAHGPERSQIIFRKEYL